ncbi:MAG: histidinol dehydrogenase, partial [Armatimonadetes bacterium]|nr:histidinol dehydrogenase [Armatimonadota bacterium]
PRIVVATPPRRDGTVHPTVLVAAAECGVGEIYRVGGAQAVAALAFGTQTIPRVDKIVGPGNAYVMEAKRAVFGVVGIDNLAGPSEAAIIADESAPMRFVAADLLAQAEHSGDNVVALLTPHEPLIDAVAAEIERLLSQLSRADVIEQSLAECGALVLVESLEQAADLVNVLAPEHLQLMVEDPIALLSHLEGAGAIFIGPFSPVPLGDYLAGPSHVLPTNRSARFSSGLSVSDFVTTSSIIWSSRAATLAAVPDVVALAEAEGLTAHAEAMRVRENTSV